MIRADASLRAALVGAALALAASAFAAEAAAAPPEENVLRVAMTGSYPPLHEETDDGGRAGLEADLARELGVVLRRQVRFVGRKETGVGAIDAVATGKADVAISAITPTDERRALVDFTRPYLTLRYRLAGGAAEVVPGGGVVTRGRKIAVPKGPAVAAARKLLPGARIVEAPSLDKALQLVARGKAHLAFGEDVGLILALRAADDLRMFGPPMGESPIAIAVPKGQVARYDQVLADLSGRIGALVEEHGPGVDGDAPRVVYLTLDGAEGVYALDLEDPSLSEHGEPPGDVEWQDVGGGAGLGGIATVDTGVGLPKALRRRARELEDPAAVPWAQLEDGTVVAFEKWRTEDECGGEEMGPDGKMQEYRYACGEEGYRVAVFRNGGVRVTSVTTLVEGT